MPKVTTNPKLSSRYLERLRKYTDVNLVTPTRRFCCADYKRCKASLGPGHGFGPGQMSYVGPDYAASVGRNVVQILVVSMQVGDATPVTLDQRSLRVRGRIDMTPGQRNAHMRGVTLALQLLWGQPPYAEYECLPGTDIHVLDAYAMTNTSLCSDLPTHGNSRRGAPTGTMLGNCARHLRATIERLEPTVIHSQGRRAFAPSTHHSVRSIVDDYERIGTHVAWVRIGKVEAIWCSLAHPSAGPLEGWSWPTRDYFRKVAAPALRKTSRLAGIG